MTKSLFTRHSLLASALLLGGATFTQGCLQRDVIPQEPNTSNVFVDRIANDSINEIDLLFVIDNSVSMADKQQILVDAVPQMVQRLISPGCKNGEDPATNPDCEREFAPVDDIHIGVISSSLGGHGSTSCPRNAPDFDNDDQGWLIPRKRAGLPDPTGLGFLAWTGPPQDAAALVNNFAAHVGGAGERGCGFEAPLEAWYRFLVDPTPPQEIVREGNVSVMANGVVDGDVLAQREAFLRPEGLVAIVVLTDENDCSAMDGGEYYSNAGYGYLIAQTNDQFRIATDKCKENPNDKCCFSCMQTPPAGCDADASVCDAGTKLLPEEDRANVRCFQNKRRFGIDLLYPTSRYVNALTRTTIIDARDGIEKANPLLTGVGANAGKGRSPDLVFFAGIVGVPWQDVATPEALLDSTIMRLQTATELTIPQTLTGGVQATRWEVILGKPGIPMSDRRCRDASTAESSCGQLPVPPLDPFMIESIAPRADGQAHPLVPTELILPYTSATFNGINGHEADHTTTTGTFADGPQNDDLQYACIFPLGMSKLCDDPMDASCDCNDEPSRLRPLCQSGPGAAAGTTQHFGKAYPGTRVLQVLRDFGENSIVSSICPKITEGDRTNPNYGYNPAVQAIVDRLAEKLQGKCLPRELTIDEEGSVPCTVVEARLNKDGGSALDCSLDGREEVDDVTRPAVLKELESGGACGPKSGNSCDDYVMCKVKELTGSGRQDCLYRDLGGGTQATSAGFCYIDPAKTDSEGNYIAGGDAEQCAAAGGDGCSDGNNPIVAECPATQKRLLRFVGHDASPTPTPGTTTFVACTGDAADTDSPIPPPPSAPSAPTGTGGSAGM